MPQSTKKYVIMNEEKGLVLVGTFFSISQGNQATLYDEDSAELAMALLALRGIKGFVKFEYLGVI